MKFYAESPPPPLLTWKTQSWQLQIFQSMMGFSLFNKYLAYKYLILHRLTLCYVCQAMCALTSLEGTSDESLECWPVTRAARVPLPSLTAPRGLPHCIWSVHQLGVGGKLHEGMCKLCKCKYASRVCKTCSTGLDTDKQRMFSICLP